ncbi:MAG: DUF4013 domain-containing protein [Candidatus Methanoperedens sp.]|nr:DUF4013 domain-containing protein [Candidatus Methanoperedens sp.]
MEIIEEIKFPSTNKDWGQKVLIGGILNMIPIINFLSSGYNLKVMKEALENKPEMPQWDDWGNFFVRGLIAFIIGLVYMIIPIIVLFVSLGSMAFGIISGDKSMALGAIGGAIGGILISLVLLIIFGFLIPMALAMYIKEDNIGAAFRFGELLSRIRSVFGEYLTVYIVLMVLLFVLGLFGAVPILGFLIMIFGGFYIQVVGANMFGKIYAKSTG